MSYKNPRIAEVAILLNKRLASLDNKEDILHAVELKALFEEIKTLLPEDRGVFGKETNELRQELQKIVNESRNEKESLPPIDISAPFDENLSVDEHPTPLTSNNGSIHPLSSELEQILDIFYRMGFSAVESREIDDEYNMFSALNFPKDHPARDDYDTFMTTQVDKNGNQFIAPAHTSTMQNRVLKNHKAKLDNNQPVAVIIPGRVFRNEDLDARHEHTFHQLEGVFVSKDANVGNLIATLKTFLQEYYGRELDIMTQPFYFPFTEPSFEFAASCPFCDKQGCSICSQTGWIEIGGCGMIHPNVLTEAEIDPVKYSGFAWGFGIERMAMLKHDIEDIRHFESGKLEFLRQFK